MSRNSRYQQAQGYRRQVNESTFVVPRFITSDGFKDLVETLVAWHYGNVSLREGKRDDGKGRWWTMRGSKDG